MKKTVSKGISHGRIAENRRAKFDYTIIDTIEAGIILLGSEVKSLRLGRASIAESYATEESGHIVLINSNIPEYSSAASGQNHEPKRIRRLLIHKKERNKVFSQIKKDGCTVIPLSLYFNPKGLAKLSLGIAEGKRKVDKREVIKKRDWDREKHRILKNNN
jgi:SsrA-binding protein